MVEVTVRSLRNLKAQVQVGAHNFLTDEPEAAGGEDAGPDPYSLLLAALGACTAMTLQLYARRKQWPLEKVEVSLRHSHVHANDCLDCRTKEGKINRIERYISLDGPLTDEQRARLFEIAEKC